MLDDAPRNDADKRLLALAARLALALAVGVGAGSGCADLAAEGAGGTVAWEDTASDTGSLFPDVITGIDIGPIGPETSPDSVIPRKADEVEGAAATAGDEAAFFHPPTRAERSSVAVGDGRIAWVERPEPGGEASLVLWSPEDGGAPRTLSVPYLSDPRELALGETWLAYVDDRYGDADIFAVRLEDGLNVTVAALPRAQERPTLLGSTVAWQDCRGCAPGEEPAPEIYARTLPGGTVSRMTFGPAPDRAPALGRLENGAEALAWITGEGTIRVISPVLDQPALTDFSQDTGEELGALALSDGKVAWRQSPTIINPDTMMPSDVFRTAVIGAGTTPITVHALWPGDADADPRASSGVAAWIEGIAGTDVSARRVVLAGLDGPSITARYEIPGAVGLDIGPSHLAVVAPRDDNLGMMDLWGMTLGGGGEP